MQSSTTQCLSASRLFRSAEAIARPGSWAGLLLPGGKNLQDRRAPLEEAVDAAVRGAVAAFIEVRDGVLCLDFDSSSGIEDARELGALLGACGYPAVVCRSGQPGRAHLFAVVPEGEQHDWRIRGKERGGDVRDTIRAPGWPHRLPGLRSEVVSIYPARGEPSLDSAIAGLSGRPPKQSRPSMQALYRAALDRQVPKGKRSEQVGRVCLLGERLGYAADRVYADLTASRGGAGEKVIEKRRLGAAYVTDVLRKQRQFARKNPLTRINEHRQELHEVRDRAIDQEWPGRSGRSDQLVWIAALTIGIGANRIQGVHLSARRIGAMVGLGKSTVTRAIARLVAQGKLTKAGGHRWSTHPTPNIPSSFNFQVGHMRMTPPPPISLHPRYGPLHDSAGRVA